MNFIRGLNYSIGGSAIFALIQLIVAIVILHILKLQPLVSFHSHLLLSKPIYPYRVSRLPSEERTRLYWRAKIGFNMHVSGQPFESGNMRTYESPAHGMLMISDKGAGDGYARIFEPACEAVYYDSPNQAVELIEHYLANDDERVRIAKAGFERYWRDYQWEENLLRFLGWADGLQRN